MVKALSFTALTFSVLTGCNPNVSQTVIINRASEPVSLKTTGPEGCRVAGELPRGQKLFLECPFAQLSGLEVSAEKMGECSFDREGVRKLQTPYLDDDGAALAAGQQTQRAIVVNDNICRS